MTEAIKTYDFKAGLPTECEIVSFTRLFQLQKSALTLPHRTAFYHVIWFQKGQPTHQVDFYPISIQPNTLLFLNKDTVHLFDPSGNFEAQAILFTDQFFCTTEADTKFLRTTILFNDLLSVAQIHLGNSAPVFQELFRLMEQEAHHCADVYHPAVLQKYLHTFLLLAERERRKQNFIEIKNGADLEYTILFKDLLEKQYKQVKQVSRYAHQLSMTEKRLNQATTNVLGKSPKRLIDERVMLEAKRLLAHTTGSSKEIGFMLGFGEPTNFIKYFRKHQGVTPVEFRETYL